MSASVFWVALLAAITSGCATTQSVRYVYQDRNFGVIGMPENTNHWPTYYHHKAEKLMGEHFPEGYEVVRAEEVTEGSRDAEDRPVEDGGNQSGSSGGISEDCEIRTDRQSEPGGCRENQGVPHRLSADFPQQGERFLIRGGGQSHPLPRPERRGAKEARSPGP